MTERGVVQGERHRGLRVDVQHTEQIARAIAVGLGESVDVQVAEVTDAPTEPDPEVAQ
jgi:hypothetical protein